MRLLTRLTPRLILSHLLVIAVAMGLLGFLLLSLVRGYFEQSASDALLVQARLVARGLTAPNPLTFSNVQQSVLPAASNAVQQQSQNRAAATPGVTAAPFTLNAANLQLTSQLATRVRVVDAGGTVLADSAGSGTGALLTADPLVAAALGGAEARDVSGGEVRVAAPLPAASGGPPGAVYLSQPLTDVAAVLADLRGRLLLSAAVALLLSALVGLVLARAIARPVDALTAAANRLAAGDFEYPLAVRSPDELARLARSFTSMRDELHRTLQARTELVANVSHELRTPLTAIKGLTETLRDGAVDDLDARDRFLASIETQTDRLIRLVNDLLLLSRADAGALTLHLAPVHVAEVAREVSDDLIAAAPGRDITVHILRDPNSPELRARADPDRLRQILMNLLNNALAYSPPGRPVSVRVEKDGDEIAISVTDQGPGVQPADLPHLFERFYRADRSRQRADASAGGSGLGLAIVKTLVEAHGGTVTVVSEPGAGATFRFTTPLA